MYHKKLLAIVFAVAMASVANAEMPYIGFDVQHSTLDQDDTVHSLAGQIRIGTHITPYIGAEVHLGSSITDTGEKITDDDGINFDSDLAINYAFSAFVKPTLPLDERVSVYALLGGSYINMQGENDVTASGNSLAGGAGFTIKFAPRLSLGVDYVQYEKELRGINLGLRYTLK